MCTLVFVGSKKKINVFLECSEFVQNNISIVPLFRFQMPRSGYRKYNGVDKADAAKIFLTEGYRAACVKYGEIPLTTLKGWAVNFGIGLPHRPSGRPPHLSDPQEQALMGTVRQLRRAGGPLDLQTLQVLGNVVSGRPLSVAWAKYVLLPFLFLTTKQFHLRSFKARHGLSNLHTPSSDRLNSTPSEIVLDNDWRRTRGVYVCMVLKIISMTFLKFKMPRN